MNENIESVLATLDVFRTNDEMTYSAYSTLHDEISLLDGLMKEQEPRVLTLKEVQNDCPDYVYIEWNGYCICCIKDEGESNKSVGYFVYGIEGDYFQFLWYTYGVIWRCWTAMPTDEQRKAVKWE